MSSAEEIFSLRLVVADFYMEKPVPGLDTCYSEFRSREIKRVPIIRIFGSNTHGQKTCMHVHGVFPYFYIPYDQKDFESLNQAVYQIALNIDKAINISLSQGSSSAQHVFKVQLVKGIPFYGYHRSDHLFLKIYMFNPRFVRRAANLLQNGAILNKNFHPHESHVPYILQFMIDFNLYGMSFLHVPLEIVKFRRSEKVEEIPLRNLKKTQILDLNLVKKISCSSLEVDIGSNFILNRFQLVAKTNTTHSNPGIESIWHDERLRRQQLAESIKDEENVNAIPPLEVPKTQERFDVQPAESELFYRTRLLSRLLSMETSVIEPTRISDQTLNSSQISNALTNPSNLSLCKQQKRIFNLTKILQNFVYPEECTQNVNLINASFIPNHLNNNSIFEQSLLINSNPEKDEENYNYMDDTLVDEELVLNLTESQHHKIGQQQQHVPLNATLRDVDIELLDILQQLEENNDDKIDLDSTLAPLTQDHQNFTLSPQKLDKETTAAALEHSTVDSDSEVDVESDENLHDFSITLENLDDLLLKLTQSQNKIKPSHKSQMDVPQVDGADDLLKSPSKSATTVTSKSLPHTPTTPKSSRSNLRPLCRSPRTPKSIHKYAALPLVSLKCSITKTTTVHNSNETSPIKRNTEDQNSLPRFSLRKKLALSDLRRKSISVDIDLEKDVNFSNDKTSQRRSKRSVNLDKTHVTCSLTPRRTNKKILKVYNVENCNDRIKRGDEDLTSEIINKKYVTKAPQNNNNHRKQTNVKKLVSANVSKSKKIDYRKGNLTEREEDNRENREKCLPGSETYEYEEIIDSDDNTELSLENEQKIKCKRLRRSFIATNSGKRNRVVRKLTNIIDSNSSTPENSSTFNCSIENGIDKKNSFKLKECKVKLKRLEKMGKEYNSFGTNKNKDIMNECNSEIAPVELRIEKELENPRLDVDPVSSHKIVNHNNVVENLTCEVDKQQTFSNLQKIGNALPSKKVPVLDSIDNYPSERNQTTNQQNLSQNLENLHDALKLHVKSIETFDVFNPVTSLARSMSFDVLPNSNSLPIENSDEEITETPPKEGDISFRHTALYNKSLSLQSPVLFSQNSSPILLANGVLQKVTPCRTNSIQSESHITLSSSSNHSLITPETKLILTPLDLPPSREEVSKGCHKLQLPEYVFQQPFYSNPDDITKHKELGFNILQIPGNKLNDVEEFQSILGSDVKGLTAWRREQLIRLGGVEMLNRYRNTQSIREYFCNHKFVIISPQFNVPTRQEVKLWLKARELLKSKGEDLEELRSKSLEEDSPIKIRRQKVTMMLNDDNSLDSTPRSLTLTPLTPATPELKVHRINEEMKRSFSPVTRNLEKTYLRRDMSRKKRSNCRVLRCISVNKQLKQSTQKPTALKCSQNEVNAIPTTQFRSDSQNSETSVTSETALANLERSSFMRYIKESDITIGYTDNSSLNNTFGFKVALENLQQAKADVEFNYLTIIALEIFVATRDDLYPNPELDEIRCLFYAIENSVPNNHTGVGEKSLRNACGYIMVHDKRDIVHNEGRIHGIDIDIEVTVVQTEVEALEALLSLCSRWDPDIYAGYEIEMSSWGFVIERAKYLCLNIAPLLSRVPTQKVRDFVDEDRESFTDLDVEMKLCGRILLDVWRLLRSEIALTSYSFENTMYHILHKRCPWHSYRNLTEWFALPCSRWIVIEYYLERVRGTLRLLDQLDLIGRTSEMAKLIGIQFYEVLSRGSQFRVESMMLRIAKPQNIVPLSPSVQQRAHMRAPEYLPLIMEPQSRFYADPLIVLDFQSLYPSMIIAYNYCFSTCLGRVEHLGQPTPFEFGASQLRVSPAMLRKLVDNNLINISPCGVAFVKSSVREGVLPRMLTEILDTRQMVKESMKVHKSNTALQRILHSRQLGLKLMANVTYGYTAANFSGRMPAVEVGDSVVAKGRETLERAIKMVETNDKWNVKVVYGDTDSMFVLVPGRNRDEAFRIGAEIAEAVTKQNPHPVKLKLEKVYQPCILQTKKRYVGYMYENPEQKEPVYEAKGIETVRRDGCPIVAKMLEKVLRILFESADVSQVKLYVCRQFTKLLSGRANLQDLIFAKEFRGLNGYRPTACVPALELTRKWIQTDPRRVPRRGERVPFLITNGPPGVPLIRLVRHPHEVLADEGLKVNAIYYITKAIIPPLNRCLLLIGADVNEWFANLPRKILLTPAVSIANEIISCPNPKSKKSTISQFFSTTNCIAECGRQTKHGLCSECSQNSTRSVVILNSKISKIERSYLTTQHICQACCGRVGDLKCDSLDCPVLYVMDVNNRNLQQIVHFRNLMEERFLLK